MAQLRLTLEDHPELQADFEGVVEPTAHKDRFQVSLERVLPAECPMRQVYEVVVDYLHHSRAFKFRQWLTRHRWKTRQRGDIRPFGLIQSLSVGKLPEPAPGDRCLAFKRDVLRLGGRTVAVREADALASPLREKDGPVRFAQVSDDYFRHLREQQFGRVEAEECHVHVLDERAEPAEHELDWGGAGYSVAWKSCDGNTLLRVHPAYLLIHTEGGQHYRPLGSQESTLLQARFAALQIPPNRRAQGGERFILGPAQSVRYPLWGPFLEFMTGHLQRVGRSFVVRRVTPEGDQVIFRSG